MTIADLELDMSQMHSFRGVWSLSSLDKSGTLTAQFLAWPIVYGKDPLWVVYSARTGKFICYGGRAKIGAWYPNMIWRRVMVRWSIVDTENHSVARRTEEMENLTGKIAPKRR